MTTASNAIKACIEDNWNAGSGGTEPTVYTGAEEGMYPNTAEWVFLKTWEYAKRRKRRNDSFVKEDDYVGLRVYTRNHANKEERLDEMVNEIYRIVTPTNVTGYHKVDIIDQHRRGTDKRQEMYVADLTVELKILSTASSAVPGSTASGNDWSMDSLIFTDGGSKVDIIRDEDNMASDDENALATQQSIKAYVTSSVAAENELSEMNDVVISAPADNEFLAYHNATSKWTNQTRAEAGIADSDIDHDALANFAANEHFLKTEIGIDDLDDTTLTGAYLEDLLMFGSGNATYVPTIIVGALVPAVIAMTPFFGNHDNTNTYWIAQLPLPTNKGGLKLYIDYLRLDIYDADASNYVNEVKVYLTDYNSLTTVLPTGYTDNRTAQGSYTYAIAAQDCSAHKGVFVRMDVIVATQYALDIAGAELRCYYAT